MKPTTLVWCAAVVAACANVTPPSPLDTGRLAEARRLLASDPDAALTITDDLLARNPSWREARLAAAEGSLRLAQRGSSTRTDLLLQDAVRNFELALEEAPAGTEPATWLMLAECRFELGDFPGASEAASTAARAFAEGKGPDAQRRTADAMLLAGRSSYRIFAAERQIELDTGEKDPRGIVRPSKDVTALANTAIGCFESARREYPGEATTQIALVYQWLNQDSAVAAELERGLRSAPAEAAIHDAYIAWMTGAGQYEAMLGAYARFVRENPRLPLLRWHQGRAVYSHADQLRAQGNFQGATAGYAKAKAVFGEYGTMVPGHAASTNQWLALCELSIARTAVELGDLPGARQHLFAAEAISPLVVAYDEGGKPQLVDSFGSHYAGIVFAIHRSLAESGEGALARTLEFNEAVLQRHPDRWGFVYNNAALAARDLGVQVARDGGAAGDAMALWERSYGYYEKAVALSPDDARIVNDCGLMLIYHLNRDFDRARTLFDRAIAVGQPQLDAMPPDAEPRDRELLEEAIGDAWQNIAVLMLRHLGKPFEEYRPFCEKAVQYYPYQRREAAALLRQKGANDPASLHRSRPAASAAAQGGAADALAKVQPQVQAKVTAQDYDGALTILDGLAKECREYAPYHAQRGDLTLKLAVQSRDAGRKGTDLLFQDSVVALKKAVELDSEPVAPRLQLAQALYETGALEQAATTASGLLLHMQSQGGGKPAELAAVHTLRANAAARAYATGKADDKDLAEMLTAARASFRLLEQQDRLDASLRSLWSVTEQWAGAPAESVNVFVRGLQKNPDDQVLLAAVVDTAEKQKQLPLAVEALQGRTDATGLWYLGKARYLLANAEREASRNAEAQKALDAARQSFEQSMQKNASYRDSSEQWIAMCLGKKGNIAFWSDDLANAEAWLLESTKLRPDRIAEDLGLAETTKLGLLRVADKHFKKGDLAKVEAIYRTASDAATGDLDLLNNSGLFARDHGNELERAGKVKEAMGMYEQSYKAYRRAQQLDPASVRLRNDCALIAIWHLERDWELSREMLDSAIADGEKKLRDDPPADREEKQQLEEAVGDCYENLALWHLKHKQDGAAAKAAAQKSQEYHPGQRRPNARRHLQAAERLLQGK